MAKLVPWILATSLILAQGALSARPIDEITDGASELAESGVTPFSEVEATEPGNRFVINVPTNTTSSEKELGLCTDCVLVGGGTVGTNAYFRCLLTAFKPGAKGTPIPMVQLHWAIFLGRPDGGRLIVHGNAETNAGGYYFPQFLADTAGRHTIVTQVLGEEDTIEFSFKIQ